MKLLFRPRASILELERLGAYSKGQTEYWCPGHWELWDWDSIPMSYFHVDPSHPGKPANRGEPSRKALWCSSVLLCISLNAYIQNVLLVFQNCIRILFLQLSRRRSPCFSGGRTVSYTYHTSCPCPASPFLYPRLNGCVRPVGSQRGHQRSDNTCPCPFQLYFYMNKF